MNSFVAIELLPDHIDIALRRGCQVVDSRRIKLDLPGEAGEWRKALRNAADLIAAAVIDLNAQGSWARILFRSPTQAVDLTGVTMSSTAQAEEAAALDCLGGLSYSMDQAVYSTRAMSKDTAGEPRKTHVLVAADRADVVETLFDVFEGASLRIESATPIDAAMTALVTQRALRRTTPCQGWLYVGEQSSFFLIAGDGRLHFGRSLNLGVDTLARTLTRPIRVRGQEEPVELDLAVASAIIHQCGIPRGEQIVHEPLGLTGTQLRPLVQPVLQRFVVELRQSLRFALPDQNLADLTITLLGPGGGIAGLDGLVADELGVHAQRGESDSTTNRETPGSPGSELFDLTEDGGLLRGLTILPPARARVRRAKEMRRWLIAGTAAALMLVGMDALQKSTQLDAARDQAAQLKLSDSQDGALLATQLKLTNAMASLTKLENAVTEAMQANVSYGLVLHDMSTRTPTGVQLTNLTFSGRDGKSLCAVRGYATQKNSSTSDVDSEESVLRSFITKLEASPLVSQVTLHNVERSTLMGRPVETFQVSVEYVPMPPSLQPSQIVSADNVEEQP